MIFQNRGVPFGQNKFATALGFLVGALLAVFLGCDYLGLVRQELQAKTWVPISATVDSVSKHSNKKIEIAYDYNWKGSDYQGTRFSFEDILGSSRMSSGDQARWAENHPTGSQITVYVDVKKPTDCVVIRTPSDTDGMILAFAFLMVASAILELFRRAIGSVPPKAVVSMTMGVLIAYLCLNFILTARLGVVDWVTFVWPLWVCVVVIYWARRQTTLPESKGSRTTA